MPPGLHTPAVPVDATRQSPVDIQDEQEDAVVKDEGDDAYRHLASTCFDSVQTDWEKPC